MYLQSPYIVYPNSVTVCGLYLQLVLAGRQIDVTCRTIIIGFIPFILQPLQAIGI